MADEQNEPQPNAPGQEKNSGGTMKLLVISLVMSLVMSAAVGAGVYFLITSNGPPSPDPETDQEEQSQKPSGPPIYFEISDPFIVNLSEQPGRFLQVSVQVMTRDSKVIEAIETHMPVLRNNLLLLFSSQTLEQIATRDGKDKLRRAAIEEIREVLRQQSAPDHVEDVYFTSLVVQ